MTTEWTSSYNPFNSLKVLLWRQHLEGCATDNYLPPVAVNVDPTLNCQSNCVWCIVGSWRKTLGKTIQMPKGHLLKIENFIHRWGVKAVCLAGGGEGTLHPDWEDFVNACHNDSIEVGVITNGIQIEDKIPTLAKKCRWVGISLDSASQKTFVKVHRVNKFNTVVNNVKHLVDYRKSTDSKLHVTVKFLIHPLNYHEVADAVLLSYRLGADAVHIRPAGWENIDGLQAIDFTNIVREVDKQIDSVRDIESEHFAIYGIKHKFTADMQRLVRFSRCWASPLTTTFCADGTVSLCCDLRGKPNAVLSLHYPEPSALLDVWNSKRHVEMVKNIEINKCPRCVFTVYNEVVEKTIIEDKFCRNFP